MVCTGAGGPFIGERPKFWPEEGLIDVTGLICFPACPVEDGDDKVMGILLYRARMAELFKLLMSGLSKHECL